MKNKILILALGLLLGAGVTEAVNYFAVNAPYNRALDAEHAQIAQLEAQAAAQADGWTLIETAASPAAPSKEQLAANLLELFGGRKLSELSAMIAPPAAPDSPLDNLRVVFFAHGQFHPLAADGQAAAFYQTCDAHGRVCSDPAMVPLASEAQR